MTESDRDAGAAGEHVADGVMSGEAWTDFCDALRRAGQRVLGPEIADSPRMRAEGFRHLTRFLSAGLVGCMHHDDPAQPVFGRLMDVTMPWGLDNPDCLYLYAPLAGDGVYHVFGQKGTARHIDFQVNFGHFAEGEIAKWGTISSIDGLRLETDEIGGFELQIGGPERAGNWLPLAPNAEFLLVRQYFDDWERERPADLLIEREDSALPMHPPSPHFVGDRLQKLVRWLDRGGLLWATMSRGFVQMAPNSILMHRADRAAERAGLRGQTYGMGNFHCEPGEGVLVEFSVPSCHHFGVALANEFWECIEFATHQSSLNRSQAVIGGDGWFRALIAHDDPGIANWLDPAGLRRGTLSVRFLGASETPDVSLRRGPIDALVASLPPGTQRISSEERRAALVRRRRAVHRRYRR
jgi:hypothetical protein